MGATRRTLIPWNPRSGSGTPRKTSCWKRRPVGWRSIRPATYWLQGTWTETCSSFPTLAKREKPRSSGHRVTISSLAELWSSLQMGRVSTGEGSHVVVGSSEQHHDLGTFSPELVTVSKDKAIHVLDVEQGRLERRISKAHGAPINSLLLVDENVLATGDDAGCIRLWDQRKEGPLMDMRQHEEYIADMALDPAKKLLLTASGDGCLGVFNIKRRRFELLSEPQSGDLTCVTLMKCGKKVACGSSEGTIYLFNWNGFGATSDRFALRAESIDCMVPVTESLLCTGSTDGVIRAVNILPNRVVGSVGQHAGEPVEELALSHCGRFLASSGHDQRLKFWDLAQLRTVVVDDYRRRKKKGGSLRALSSKAWSTDDFFAGLREEGEDSVAREEEESEDDSD
ncbi:WD repeat-containing protein 55 isoform X1 [Lemur catta]|uniref:WD repeat-containing protein 55 isoform X1 n=1 Tax=Lemur catta TaxID=9447 RepID=UPI001E26C750|nr:WD repeat-containing protein 55 isoform X1 [Lemur catta]